MKIILYNLHNMCEHNTLFLTRARRYFEINNHQVVDNRDNEDSADLVFIGGCAVTDAMRARCEEQISNIVKAQEKKHGQARVVVFGCLAAFPEKLSSLSSNAGRIDLIAFRQSARLDELIGARVPFERVNINRLQGHVPYQPCMGPEDVYVLIAQGCVNDCSYCTIKKAKGQIISRAEADIEAEVGLLYQRGVGTVTLLADDCGSFGLDAGSSLSSLLDRLSRTCPDMRYKIYTMFPALFLQQARQLEPFIAARRIAYLCLPAQSGSSRILTLMNRRYDPGQLAEAVGRLRRLDPTLFVYTHFIYNFPTESWTEFKQSVELAGHFDHCVFIGYGENSGTRAADIFPKCDNQSLMRKTGHLENLVEKGRLAAFVVSKT